MDIKKIVIVHVKFAKAQCSVSVPFNISFAIILVR